MATQSNIHFKVNMTVDGKQQAVELGMAMGDLENVLSSVEKATQKTRLGVASAMATMEYAVNAVSRLNSTFTQLSKAYAIQQEAETKLATNMRNTMAATDAQIQSIKDLCSAQQEIGVVGDEVQLAGAQELASYLGTTEALKKLIPVMNDMIVQQNGLGASGESAATIATMLGKVMQGQTGALKRLGYEFDAAQKEILETGGEMERAAVLAEVVQSSVGGMNEAMRQTASGNMQAMINDLGDSLENLGAVVIKIQPYINQAASFGMAATSFMQLSKAIGLTTVTTKLFTPVMAKANAAVSSLGKTVAISAKQMGVASTACRLLSVAVQGLVKATAVGLAIWAVVEAFQALTGSVNEAKAEFDSVSSAISEMSRTASEAGTHIQSQADALKKLMDSGADTTEAVAGLNREYGDMFGQMKTAAEWYDTLIAKSADYAQALGYQAQLQSLNGRLLEIKAEQDYQHKVEKSNRTGRYSGTTKHNDAGKAAVAALSQLKEEEAKVVSMIGYATDRLSEISLDTSLLGEEWKPAEKDTKSPIVKAEPVLPPGSLAHISKQISNLQTRINLEVDPQSRADLYKELSGLESQKRYIEWRMKTPDLSGETLRALGEKIQSQINNSFELKLPELVPANFEYKGPQPKDDGGFDVEQFKNVTTAIDAVTDSMRAMSAVTSEAASAWLTWSASTIKAITAALPQIVSLISAKQAQAEAETMGQNAAMGPFGWIAGIAAMASIAAAFASLPKFANGGIAYGPTVGLFGEYPGAANNPEVVAPLSKLESLIEPREGLSGKVRFVIEGRTLVGMIEKENKYSSKRS